MPQVKPILYSLILIFTLSGFSGLIYQSIWSHYLKLFLGHASYAQILVLAIFMGGMAIGSALAARFSHRLTNLILWYGIIEGIIGLFGIGFHGLFVSVQGFAFESLFPQLGSPGLIHASKWTLGALLILPQSILLGATFPLLAAGIIRRFPGNTGNSLATLYFVNSLGAAIGVLFNAFVFIPNLGLPGAVLTAGLINIALAILVYRIAKNDRYPAPQPTSQQPASDAGPTQPLTGFFLLVAAGTGLASFMYEIGWIRMLSMVLGGSTHSFEIMLSAFILGLAIGGFWIRKKIDRFQNPLLALGLIQLAMGTLAALTIPIYNQTYELMGFVMDALNRNDSGYLLYTLFSYGISLLVMLPATICAGTTLPLITYLLMRQRGGDEVIGKVYAWNTLGSILGVVLAVQLVMPWLGLKWVIVGGALVDVALGAWLIQRAGLRWAEHRPQMAFIALCALVFLSFPLTGLDTQKMASGVYRYGYREDIVEHQIPFHKDGKTSTVAVKQDGDFVVMLNNGKPDAGLYLRRANEAGATEERPKLTGDEPTMVLLGSLPYVYKPDAQYIANIGLGSGLTAHALLGQPQLKRLDSIEIEQAVVEAAQLFRPNVDRLFTDPRSRLIIEDAKTHFASAGQRYDVIVSEPPNPWVSGVASLFSAEFYRDIQRYLSQDGVFVQWMHLYEISPNLVATVYQALRQHFAHIHLYQLNEGDMAIVASRQPLRADYQAPYKHADLRAELVQVGIPSAADLAFRRLAAEDKLDLIFAPYGPSSNSDFFPLLDNGAAKARFTRSQATTLWQLRHAQGLDALLAEGPNPLEPAVLTETRHLSAAQGHNRIIRRLNLIQGYLATDAPPALSTTPDQLQAWELVKILRLCRQADAPEALRSEAIAQRLIDLSLELVGLYPFAQTQQLMQHARPCMDQLAPKGGLWIRLHLAWFAQDHAQALELTSRYLAQPGVAQSAEFKHLMRLYLASQILSGQLDPALAQHRANAQLSQQVLEINALYRLLDELNRQGKLRSPASGAQAPTEG
jgi:predicted membrane-bound spermidine synthase